MKTAKCLKKKEEKNEKKREEKKNILIQKGDLNESIR